MKAWLVHTPVRLPLAVARHLPDRLIEVSFSHLDILDINRRAKAMADSLREHWD